MEERKSSLVEGLRAGIGMYLATPTRVLVTTLVVLIIAAVKLAWMGVWPDSWVERSVFVGVFGATGALTWATLTMLRFRFYARVRVEVQGVEQNEDGTFGRKPGEESAYAFRRS